MSPKRTLPSCASAGAANPTTLTTVAATSSDARRTAHARIEAAPAVCPVVATVGVIRTPRRGKSGDLGSRYGGRPRGTSTRWAISGRRRLLPALRGLPARRGEGRAPERKRPQVEVAATGDVAADPCRHDVLLVRRSGVSLGGAAQCGASAALSRSPRRRRPSRDCGRPGLSDEPLQLRRRRLADDACISGGI